MENKALTEKLTEKENKRKEQTSQVLVFVSLKVKNTQRFLGHY